jgi:RNA polymerase sigma factor (sigma-70 family)
MTAIETPEAPATTERPQTTNKKVRGPRTKRVELTPEQRELTQRFQPMARSLSRMIKLKWSRDREEFDAVAEMALVEAAQAFNPRRGVKFTTFARFRIIGALKDFERYLYNKAYPRQMPDVARAYHYVPGEAEGAALMLKSRDEPVGSEIEAAEEVEHWLQLLPPRHARACRELYVAARTQGQAAEAMGCVKSRVCTLHAEALEILRQSPAVREAALALGLDVGRN